MEDRVSIHSSLFYSPVVFSSSTIMFVWLLFFHCSFSFILYFFAFCAYFANLYHWHSISQCRVVFMDCSLFFCSVSIFSTWLVFGAFYSCNGSSSNEINCILQTLWAINHLSNRLQLSTVFLDSMHFLFVCFVFFAENHQSPLFVCQMSLFSIWYRILTCKSQCQHKQWNNSRAQTLCNRGWWHGVIINDWNYLVRINLKSSAPL